MPIRRATDNDLLTAMLDYSKAFDSIDHQILVVILSFVGISKNTVVEKLYLK